MRDAGRLLKAGLALVALVFGEQHRPAKAVQFRIPLMLAGGVCCFHPSRNAASAGA